MLELAELVIMLTGVTLFQNKLSLFRIFFLNNFIIEIVLHTLATALLAWYIFKEWEGKTLWGIWACGSLVPILLEGGGLLFTYLFYRKVLRIN